MIDNKKNKEENGGFNPVIASAIGAVVGAAAIGIAGAAVLSNDENRKKMGKLIDRAKDSVEEIKTTVSEKIAEGEKNKRKAVAAKKSAEAAIKDTK